MNRSATSVEISTLDPGGAESGESPAGRPAFERLIQPLFFSGQLLTDQDLMTFLGWVRGKLPLARQVSGWGVVCGLEASAHPRHAGKVTVQPGFARSAAGEDILVTEPVAFDLATACAELTALDHWTSRPGERPPETVVLGGFSLPTASLRVIDLSIRYREQPAEPQAPLGHDGCARAIPCQFSRNHELFSLHGQPALVLSSPLDDAARAWERRVADAEEVVRAIQHAFPYLAEADWSRRYREAEEPRRVHREIKRWLLDWIAVHPLFQLSWIYDRIARFQDAELSQPAEIAGILFWLVQDARLAALAPACGAAEPAGVPLARVWMRTSETPQGDAAAACRVLLVDGQAPYRRHLARDDWPAPLGQVNLGQTLLRRWDEGCTRLADLGVEVAGAQPAALPANFDELRDTLRTELFAPTCPDQARPLLAFLLDAGPLGRRVIGLAPQPEEQPDLGLRVGKATDRDEVKAGESVTATYRATNIGDEPLTVHLVDSLYGPVTPAEGMALAPGASEEISRPLVVPGDSPRQLVTRLDGTGTAEDGRTVEAAAEHLLTVIDAEPRLGLTLSKKAELESAYPYQWVPFTYQVANTGEVDLEVVVRDDLDEDKKARKPKRVEAETTLLFSRRQQIPGTARRRLATSASALGKTADGREVEATSDHTLSIRRPDDLTLIGMLQAKAQGQLDNATRAYKAQIFTFERFAALPADTLYNVYQWTFQAQSVKSTALVEVWQSLAAQLARTPIRQAEDVVDLPDDELRRLFPQTAERRLRIFKQRAQRRVAKGWADGDDPETADEQPQQSPAPAPEAPTDDFSVLDNISKRRAANLHEAGIRTFEDLARASVAEVQAALKRRVSDQIVQRWQQQAAEKAGG